ncbi:MAG: recombinase family protein [Candidatus Eisenbacteria bacterium]|uniref:Recombinase family protein n=1 Tax=Eiseniibacteriota bacterium TaxID=2212470 RepID=A0A849SJ28_UNCEI|nr:recombinase family protein [Candidatus Eisenbacteria bacterium]
MPTHVIYARKSTESDDRQVLSIDSQIQELKLLALRRGLEVDEILTEARSAKAPGRPIFGQLMKRVNKGEIAGVFCWKMDRLARNPFDSGQILQALADRKIEQIITPERTFTGDGNDRFLGNFELGIATKFIDDLRANVKRGNRARFERGWPNFRPPVGYIEDRATKTVITDPERFPLVQKLWDELLSGRMRPMQIARAAEHEWGLQTRKAGKLGGKPLTFQGVFKLFANPYYAGLIRLKSGESYRGAHSPMITMAMFDQAQELLGRPGRSRPAHHTFAYAGMLTCGICGGTLVAEVHTKPSGRRYVYYRCRSRTSGRPCPNPCLPETALEDQLLRDLRRVSLSKAAVDWISSNIRQQLQATSSHHAARRDALEKALLEASRENEMLLTLRLRAQVDEETYERRRLQILDRQARLKIQLDEPTRSPEELVAQIEEVLNFSVSLPRAFKEGDPVRRRSILHAVCANPKVRDRKALYKAKEPFSFFEGKGSTRSWQGVVERLRNWIVEKNFQIPSYSLTEEDTVPRKRPAA